MFKHILVPTDGSDLSNKAVERAVIFARENNAQISFLYVQSAYPLPMIGEGIYISPNTPDEFAALTAQESKRVLDAALNQAQQAKVTAHSLTSVSDSPYKEIIHFATQQACDLIFMASHGRKGLTALLLGSETQKVLTHSSIPVLVYR